MTLECRACHARVAADRLREHYAGQHNVLAWAWHGEDIRDQFCTPSEHSSRERVTVPLRIGGAYAS